MADRQIQPLEEVAPLRQQVYDRLEDLIIYGALPPGEHLVESDLASRLGVSRIPIREALQLLHSNGWVELRPRFGAFVHEPMIEEVDDAFDVRTLLETESARLAAAHASPEDVGRLKQILEMGAAAVEGDDEEELVKLNSEFHRQITSISGNQILAELLGRLDKRIRWYFGSVVSTRGEASWREHEDLVAALEAGDPDRAADVMRRHAELTKTAYHESRE